MKKLALIMALVLVVSAFAGCGSSDNSVVGEWAVVELSGDGMSLKKDDIDSLMKMMGIEGDYLTMELTSDGKVKMTSVIDEDLAGEGTYKLEGDKITISVDGTDITGTVSGKTITVSEGDTGMVFEKK